MFSSQSLAQNFGFRLVWWRISAASSDANRFVGTRMLSPSLWGLHVLYRADVLLFCAQLDSSSRLCLTATSEFPEAHYLYDAHPLRGVELCGIVTAVVRRGQGFDTRDVCLLDDGSGGVAQFSVARGKKNVACAAHLAVGDAAIVTGLLGWSFSLSASSADRCREVRALTLRRLGGGGGGLRRETGAGGLDTVAAWTLRALRLHSDVYCRPLSDLMPSSAPSGSEGPSEASPSAVAASAAAAADAFARIVFVVRDVVLSMHPYGSSSSVAVTARRLAERKRARNTEFETARARAKRAFLGVDTGTARGGASDDEADGGDDDDEEGDDDDDGDADTVDEAAALEAGYSGGESDADTSVDAPEAAATFLPIFFEETHIAGLLPTAALADVEVVESGGHHSTGTAVSAALGRLCDDGLCYQEVVEGATCFCLLTHDHVVGPAVMKILRESNARWDGFAPETDAEGAVTLSGGDPMTSSAPMTEALLVQKLRARPQLRSAPLSVFRDSWARLEEDGLLVRPNPTHFALGALA